jgi:WD40 repeat protein
MSSKRAALNSQPFIESVSPPAAISGGEFEVRGAEFSANGEKRPRARLGSVPARLVIGGRRYAVVRVPEEATEGQLVLDNGSQASLPYACSVGIVIAENLHPVANPAVDRAGNIFATRSGSRGEKVPVSVFKLDPSFNLRPFNSDITNPTGLLFAPDGKLLVSSRHNGTVYGIDAAGKTEIYAEGMGVATGLALDHEGNLYVGDRTGTIFKISPGRQIFVFATIEPSISAYHLCMGPDGFLYVTGPTTSSFDCLYRVSSNGEVEVFYRGFGRPQGMCFDRNGALYIAASHGGRKGIFRFLSQDQIEQVVSGPGIVGMAFLPSGELVVATTANLYRVGTPWLRR